jgi:hypothetical protein
MTVALFVREFAPVTENPGNTRVANAISAGFGFSQRTSFGIFFTYNRDLAMMPIAGRKALSTRPTKSGRASNGRTEGIRLEGRGS